VLAPLALATVTLPPGLLLPVVHFSWALKDDTSFTVLTGITDLIRSGHTFIGLLILTFSVIFPVAKILALYGLWFLPLPAGPRGAALRWLGFLGKWSMLDVFVVGILVGTLNLGILSDATPGPGAYVFTGAVLLSMAATLRQARLARRSTGPPPLPARPSPAVPLLAVLSLLLLGAGLQLPLMTVDKWLFWKNEYSILRGTAEIFREGHTAMAAMVTMFVIAAPMLQAVGAMWVWLLGRSRRDRARLMSGLRHVGRWAMADVFALGIVVVLSKIGGVVNVTPRAGLWLFIAGTALGSGVSWHLTAPRAIRPAKVRGKGEKKRGNSRPGEWERKPLFRNRGSRDLREVEIPI
jgi:paraquat-inducible protein A